METLFLIARQNNVMMGTMLTVMDALNFEKSNLAIAEATLKEHNHIVTFEVMV